MFYKEIYSVFNFVANDKYIRLSALAITSIAVLIAFVYSPLAAFLIYTSYISGYVVCWCLIKHQNYASICLQGIINFCHGSNTVKKSIRYSCSICDDLSCKRHTQGRSVAPWKHLHIQNDLNSAIEHFYNKILENFIVFWYEDYTEDVDFLNELRYCLRFATASVINRFVDLDHSNIISTKLLPCAVKHVDDYMYMQQIVKLKNARINDVIVEYLGNRLHPATTNRKNELNYLQHLSALLMPAILPEKYMQCPNYAVLVREILAGWVFLPLMDVIADPSIINSLVILAATYKASKRTAKTSSAIENVELLDNFVNTNGKMSSFSTDLNSIKANTELLYAFMQFLKKEEHVYLLQFCLDVDEFNNKLLTPDLSKRQLEELHSEAFTLYREYLKRDSINFIGCSSDIIDEFHKLIEGGIYSVAKLRTSKPLYQAYEHTFNVLETTWLPSFFHSNEFYSQICGSKITSTYNKGSTNRGRKYYEATSQGTVAKISSGLGRIKGALKTPQPIEGAIYSADSQAVENDGVEDIIISDCSNIFRDLSAWRISILSYRTINKVVSFCINVQRLDAVDDDSKRHWVVLRRDQDFYTLKGKLVEFHGESEICDSPLPSRKIGSPLEARMTKYEKFIKNLLRKPFLRGSDLLYAFLTADEDFSLLINSGPSNPDIGNIYQSVAQKLRKEKGQNLDSFMTTFLLSTGKNKPGKIEWAEMGDEPEIATSFHMRNPPLPKTFRNHVFNDNFGISYNALKTGSISSFNPIGVTECVFYLLKYIFKVPQYFLRIFAAISSVANNALESFFGLFIERKLKSGLSQTNLAYLVQLLEDVIFDSYTTPTKDELEQRKRKAFDKLDGILSPLMAKLLGNHFSTGLRTLLEVLQYPHYNKQLAYNFLDIMLLEMYPVLGNTKDIE